MSFLSVEDLDALIVALLIRSELTEDERRALILELASRRHTAVRHQAPDKDNGQLSSPDVGGAA